MNSIAVESAEAVRASDAEAGFEFGCLAVGGCWRVED